jgi:L-ascorbate metabolism protein UlaG (beta-lactamase superfamily)
MKRNILIFLAAVVLAAIYFLIMNNKQTSTNDTALVPQVVPIEHASFVLNWNGKVIYADPVGADKFQGQDAPDLIILTDIHDDHFDPTALKALATDKTVIVMPQVAALKMPAELMPKVKIFTNGDTEEILGFKIEAIPMYNLPESPDAFHTKGRGNGYVLESRGERLYISGDTSGIPEMRALKDIDIAFVAMNLPYTMGVEEAADAVLEFAPKKVYPYHYRTPTGFSDVAKFKELVEAGGKNIEVVQLNWY